MIKLWHVSACIHLGFPTLCLWRVFKYFFQIIRTEKHAVNRKIFDTITLTFTKAYFIENKIVFGLIRDVLLNLAMNDFSLKRGNNTLPNHGRRAECKPCAYVLSGDTTGGITWKMWVQTPTPSSSGRMPRHPGVPAGCTYKTWPYLITPHV